ncbi:MAG: hypothetical protein Q6373_007325 [Candidatus Sigynarchaeota archaeon]
MTRSRARETCHAVASVPRARRIAQHASCTMHQAPSGGMGMDGLVTSCRGHRKASQPRAKRRHGRARGRDDVARVRGDGGTTALRVDKNGMPTEGMTFDIGMRLPGKLDAYKTEKLQGYIDDYMASHPASTLADIMMDDIVRAHPELGIDAATAKAFLVKNRDPNNDYRTIISGTDPTLVNPFNDEQWDWKNPNRPHTYELYAWGTGTTIGQIASDCKDPKTGAFDAKQLEVFIVDTRYIVLRVVRVDATRQDVIMSNMALLDVWCHLGWVDNPLWYKAGTWWMPYLDPSRHRKVVP